LGRRGPAPYATVPSIFPNKTFQTSVVSVGFYDNFFFNIK
jgi:hypothetical protein